MILKFGILGGTFNPIHNGHITVALKVRELLNLDKIFLMPNKIPPHKNLDEVLKEEMRLNMIELCANEFEFLDVEKCELKKQKVSYTYESLEYLDRIHKGDELFFIIGSDSFLNFNEWQKIDRIFRSSNVVVYLRDLEHEKRIIEMKKYYEDVYDAKIFSFMLSNTFGISSTKIRKMVSEGKDVSSLVPKCVNEYIIFENLYRK